MSTPNPLLIIKMTLIKFMKPIKLTEEENKRVYKDIEQKRNTSKYLDLQPQLII